MGLLESSYESAEAGPLSPPADWLRRPAPSARQRWTAGRPRCRSRSLQRRRVVSMFWGPRPPEPAGRSRSAEGSRHQPPGHAPHSGTPAEEGGGHSAAPAGPTRSAPVTPTVVTGRGAPESPSDVPAPESPGDSPPDGQYRQTLRQLTGDIHGLLRRAEADDETDDGFGDGVVDGDGGDGDGQVEGVEEDGDASINGGDVCGTGVGVDQLENQGLTMPKELSVGDGECSDASDTPLLECRSRTLPSKLCRSPAVTAGSDAAGATGGVNSGRRVRSASTTQRVSLAPGQDRSGREHNTSVPETAGAAAGDDGPAAEEERLFDDSADDVLLMLMDSLLEPVAEPVAEPAREPVPKPESEDTTRTAPECEPEPGRRQEPGRKPLSVIVVTTVIDSSDGEGSPSVPPQQRGSTDDQLHVTKGRSLQAPPDVTSPHPGESSSDAAISSDSIPNDNPDLKLAQHQLSASEVASDGAAAGASASAAASEADGASAGDTAASVDAEAAAFPRASDVDSGEPLCLLSGPQPDLWQVEEDQIDGTVRFVAGLSGRSGKSS
ncbi:hypothetical protein FJT64_018592 [Amphibalanus amphitrite]|uniref:Uncharacterized protein n=1 Tax=Amphibalanus amphitrite TaxID=1232801 RepID=A0A6A4X2S8_AMPAM|nr:hypothetical protein FJT64_018592 [Amphibalanus amphitrite]